GNIGRAKVTFELENILPHQLSSVSPGGYRFEGSSLVWEWSDFEPTENIRLVMDGRGMLAVAAWYLPEDAADLEELHRQGDHAGLLARVRALQAGATPQQQPTLLLYEARAEALYHLAGNAHAAGDRARVEAIYRQLRDSRASLAVQRWVESLLPAGSMTRSAPVVTAELYPDPHSDDWWLRIHAEDPDGDMVSLRATAWLVQDGRGEMVADERTPVGQDTYRTSRAYHVGAIPPGARVEYRVEVEDAGGLQTLVDTAQEQGRPPGDAETAPRTRSPWIPGAVAAGMLTLTAAWLRRRHGHASYQ
ncbi:MAG TPA: hypothetical protein DEQ28_06580, partial [Clostridiales bacterium]|nr:hypothetical protein [Clostridiales bacterium]